MREFFINWFEKVLAILIVLLGLVVLVSGIGVMVMPGYQGGGFFAGLMVLVGGAVYVIVFGGMCYLGLGIYHNTKRTAEATERLAASK